MKQKMTPPIVETVIEESEEEDNFDQTSEEKTQSWFPRRVCNVASLGACESRTDLDLCAHTTVLGEHCIIVHKTNCTANVSPFLPELGTGKKVQIVTGAVACDHPDGASESTKTGSSPSEPANWVRRTGFDPVPPMIAPRMPFLGRQCPVPNGVTSCQMGFFTPTFQITC
jgi:hypothetical protein